MDLKGTVAGFEDGNKISLVCPNKTSDCNISGTTYHCEMILEDSQTHECNVTIIDADGK